MKTKSPSAIILVMLSLGFTLFSGNWVQAQTALGAPQFDTTATTANSVTVNVVPANPTGATSIQLMKSTDSTNWTTVATVASDANPRPTSEVAPGLAPSTLYYFQWTGNYAGGPVTGTVANITTLAMPPQLAAPALKSGTLTATGLTFTLPTSPTTPVTNSVLLQQSTDAATWTTNQTITVPWTTGATAIVTGLTPSTAYYFRYVAQGPGNVSTNGVASSAITTQVTPPQPSPPTVSAIGSRSMTVTVPLLDPGAGGSLTWTVFKNGVSYATGQAGAKALAVTGLTANTTYSWTCQALSGTSASVTSAAKTATTLADPPSLAAPTLQAGSMTGTSLVLSLPTAPASPVTNSVVLKKSTDGNTWPTYQTLTPSQWPTTVIVAGLSPSGVYSFRLDAIGPDGTTTTGAVSSAITMDSVPVITNVTATGMTVTVPSSYAGLGGNRKWKLYLNGSATAHTTNISDGQATAVTGLSPVTTYSWTCQAYNDTTNGPVSNPISAQTLPSADMIPVAPSFTAVTYNSATVSEQPATPLNARVLYLLLQRKYVTALDSMYWTIPTPEHLPAQIVDTTPAGYWEDSPAKSYPALLNYLKGDTIYTYRYQAVVLDPTTNQNVLINGATGNLATLAEPAAKPGSPQFTSVTSTGCTVVAPPLPANAASLSLYRWAYSTGTNGDTNPPANAVPLATNLQGGATTAVTFTATDKFWYEYQAVGARGSTFGNSAAPCSPPPIPDITLGWAGPTPSAASKVCSVTVTPPPGILSQWAWSATSWAIQYKYHTAPDTSYQWSGVLYNVANYSGNGPYPYPILNLVISTNYDFRWVALDGANVPNIICTGPTKTITTAASDSNFPNNPPGGASAPTFPTVGWHSFSVKAPNQMPARGDHFQLVYLPEYARDNWAPAMVVADNLAINQVTNLVDSFTGNDGVNPPVSYTIAPTSQFAFFYRIVGTDGQVTNTPPATVTLPAAPPAPSITTVGQTSVSISLPTAASDPEVSGATTNLLLRYKRSIDDNWTVFGGNTNYLHPGGTAVTITGLAVNTSYLFNYQLVAGASFTGANAATTTGAPAPDAPYNYWLEYPIIVGSYQVPPAPNSVIVICPNIGDGPDHLPLNATSLSLQILYPEQQSLPVNQQQWTTYATGIEPATNAGQIPIMPPTAGPRATEVHGIYPGTTYLFRYVAVGPGGQTPGPSTSFTMPTMSGTWSLLGGIGATGIRLPATGTITAARGATVRFASNAATKWGLLTLTQGTSQQYDNAIISALSLTEPCQYRWSATGGSFSSGVPSGSMVYGQSVNWVAPSTAGTYTVTLTVLDRMNNNVGRLDLGSRVIAPPYPTYAVTVTVN